LLFSHGAETLHKVEELRPIDAFRKTQPSEAFVELCLDVVRFSNTSQQIQIEISCHSAAYCLRETGGLSGYCGRDALF
jgi:hypothetical protein